MKALGIINSKMLMKKQPLQVVPLVFLAVCLLFFPRTASAVFGAPQVSGNGPDDQNSSKLTPWQTSSDPRNRPDPQLTARYISYCPWINSAMTAYCNANRNYSFSWASTADASTVASRMQITRY